MLNTGNTDGIDGIALERRKKNAAQRVTYGHTETGLQGTKFELAELVGGLQHYNFIRFLKC